MVKSHKLPPTRRLLHTITFLATFSLHGVLSYSPFKIPRRNPVRRRSFSVTAASPPLYSIPSPQEEEEHQSATTTTTTIEKPCYYKGPDDAWKQRLNLADLTVGQKLLGVKLAEDLLDGKSGAKVFFECGVGRIDSRTKWQMVNGMLRLGTPNSKKSVMAKKAKRLSNKISEGVDVYVSRVSIESGQFEVCLTPDEAKLAAASETKKTNVRTLEPGQILMGKVVRVEPYGVFVDVGANRNGLLHIQTVSDFYGKYIHKQEGLLNLPDLKLYSDIEVRVADINHKRMSLKFARDEPPGRKMDYKLLLGEPNEKRIGEVLSVKDYGVYVDLGATLNGLLHIITVGKHFGKFIVKEKGLRVVSGYKEGSIIENISVLGEEDGLLRLGLLKDSEEEDRVGLEDKDQTEPKEAIASTAVVQNDQAELEEEEETDEYDDEASAWADYYNDGYDDEEDDEDKDIEDSLGLGSY